MEIRKVTLTLDIQEYQLTIASCVKRWYNGDDNNGIMLKAPDESNVYQCAWFYSSNYPSSSIPRPLFTLTYRNNKGLENYWTYSSFTVGSAGTAYINDYSGNLVFVTNDATTASETAPFSLQHVFNGYMSGSRYSKTKPYVGHGWKLNVQQTLMQVTDSTISDNYPYVYTDEDGTEHYFYKKMENNQTKYYDEDGLKLELKINNSNNNEKYTIEDDKNNKRVFNSQGLLNYIMDSNGNTITVHYASDNKTITSVEDDDGNHVYFEKNTVSDYLKSITDPNNRKTTYIYNGGRLEEIRRCDGKSVYFEYENDNAQII